MCRVISTGFGVMVMRSEWIIIGVQVKNLTDGENNFAAVCNGKGTSITTERQTAV